MSAIRTASSVPRRVVVLGIATYRRPQMLARCLRALEDVHVPPELSLIVQVMDNDAAASAEAVARAPRATLEVRYGLEPERGLSAVRNRLLDAALALDADFIAFLDDDEVAPPGWLAALWQGLQRFNADLAVGPVMRIPWEPLGLPPVGANPRPRASGAVPRKIACGNVLFARAILGSPPARFDPRLNFLGGEDHEFFDRLCARGLKAVWIEEALAFEYQLPERQAWRYLLWRHFTDAASAVARERTCRPGLRVALHYGVKGLGKLFASLLILPALPLAPRRRARIGLARLAAGLGYLAGVLGYRVERYRYSDGC